MFARSQSYVTCNIIKLLLGTCNLEQFNPKSLHKCPEKSLDCMQGLFSLLSSVSQASRKHHPDCQSNYVSCDWGSDYTAFIWHDDSCRWIRRVIMPVHPGTDDNDNVPSYHNNYSIYFPPSISNAMFQMLK